MVEQIEEYYKKRTNTIPNSPPQAGVSLEHMFRRKPWRLLFKISNNFKRLSFINFI